METRVQYLLKDCANPVTIDTGLPETVTVSRADLEIERRHVLGRLRWLNEKLGYPPILTGKERRRQAHAK